MSAGRIRSIKPEAFSDEELWDVDVAHPGLHVFRTYTGLWCYADREGRFEWRPRVLRANILPHLEGASIEPTLALLEAEGFIVSYTVAGKRYGWIPTFLTHQRPNSREADSTIPPPPDPTSEEPGSGGGGGCTGHEAPHARTRMHAQDGKARSQSPPPPPSLSPSLPGGAGGTALEADAEVTGSPVVAPPEPVAPPAGDQAATGAPKVEEPAGEPREAAGGGRIRATLADRLEPVSRGEGKPPKRHDPLGERVGFLRWGPSLELLAWAKALGLTDDEVDRTLDELRDYCSGLHDFDWYENKSLAFFQTAIRQKAEGPRVRGGPRRPNRPPDHGMTGWEALERQKREASNG